jgi:hypothetical protein
LKSLFLWSDDWFGSIDEGTGVINSGPFAYTQAKRDAWDLTHNAYGLLRAPWNNNPQPYISRHFGWCGKDVGFFMNDAAKWNSTFMQWGVNWPTCEKHFKFLSTYNTWADMALMFPYEPHGPVHAIIGGTANNCGSDLDALVPTFGAEMVNSWKAHSFNAVKDLYRRGLRIPATYCDAETPADDCKASCPTLDIVKESLKSEGGTCDLESVRAFLEWAVDNSAGQVAYLTKKHTCEELLELMTAICDATILDGDHLEAASPMDPSFWPIHPTIERLWIFKKMSGTFEDESWPGKNNRNCFNCHCYGHAAEDPINFRVQVAMETGVGMRDASNTLSNEELYNMADPSFKHLPYVYDHFDWSHCATEGYDFSEIVSAGPQS